MSGAQTARAAEQKLRILAGASRVFRRRGLHDAGMRDIAEEAGMHAGNLYYYFANKAELLAYCQDQALGGLLATARAIARSKIPADQKLRRLIVAHITQLNVVTPGSLAHLEVEALDEKWRRPLQRRRDEYEKLIRAVIRRGIRDGVFRKADARVATLAILGALNWTVKWFRPAGAMPAEKIGDEFAELLVNGLRSRNVS